MSPWRSNPASPETEVVPPATLVTSPPTSPAHASAESPPPTMGSGQRAKLPSTYLQDYVTAFSDDDGDDSSPSSASSLRVSSSSSGTPSENIKKRLFWRLKPAVREMVLAFLHESDLVLPDDIVNAIVVKTFKEADSKHDGKIDMEEWTTFVDRNPAVLKNMTLPYLV
ncbi:hypothetical protein KSS87_019800 [Heliosperma pusillum]|nr:hypothetical protein KSS87_019800 [Heliosperma pusillum]